LSASAAEVDIERPCIDCGTATLNPGRCRDCHIEYLFDLARCELCGDDAAPA
jgi:hypothetical protein